MYLEIPKIKDLYDSRPSHLIPSTSTRQTALYVNATLDPEGRLQGNEQHLVHFRLIEEILLKMTRRKKQSSLNSIFKNEKTKIKTLFFFAKNHQVIVEF